MLRLADRWIWDVWFARAGPVHHLFFLQAPRSLGDPELRHANATVGHATSRDLVTWEVTDGPVLEPGPAGAWDDVAIWTGSVVERSPGDWAMLYTASSTTEDGLVQRVGLATSPDLRSWTKHPANPVLEAAGPWYELLDTDAWFDQAWRDPWIVPTPDGFDVLLTARAAGTEPTDERGVVGHARSPDLVHFRLLPPASEPAGFGQLEVPQVVEVDGTWLLLFSCMPQEFGVRRRAGGDATGGSWLCPADGPTGPFHVEDAVHIGWSRLYSCRVVEHAEAGQLVLGFVNRDGARPFEGYLADPRPLASAPGLPVALSRARGRR